MKLTEIELLHINTLLNRELEEICRTQNKFVTN